MNSNQMPCATKVCLNVGDAVFFSAYGIHRGSYLACQARRTLSLIFSSPVSWFTPSSTCFLEHNILNDLSKQAATFWKKFIKTYENRWLETS